MHGRRRAQVIGTVVRELTGKTASPNVNRLSLSRIVLDCRGLSFRFADARVIRQVRISIVHGHATQADLSSYRY